jgi:hypothetical protein
MIKIKNQSAGLTYRLPKQLPAFGRTEDGLAMVTPAHDVAEIPGIVQNGG